jgi:hypothetical protein
MITTKEDEIEEFAVSRTNHGYSLWDEKSTILVNVLPWGIRGNSD